MRGLRGGRTGRKDHIHFAASQIGSEFGKPIEPPFAKAVLNRDRPTLDITKIAETLPEWLCHVDFALWSAEEDPYASQLYRRLSVRNERPYSSETEQPY